MEIPTWPELHGALTHFPVAMLLAAIVYEIGALVFNRSEGRLISFWLLLTGVVMAIPALATGWLAGDSLFAAAAHPPAIFIWHRLAAFVTSGVALLLLIGRWKAGDRLSGGPLIASLLAGLIAAGGVMLTGFLGGKMVFGGESPEPPAKQAPSSSARAHAPRVVPAMALAGQRLYVRKNCAGCHRLGGAGGHSGPDLTHEQARHADVAWQIAHLKHPDRVHPGSTMPSYSDLSPADLESLGSFLVSRK